MLSFYFGEDVFCLEPEIARRTEFESVKTAVLVSLVPRGNIETARLQEFVSALKLVLVFSAAMLCVSLFLLGCVM